MIKELTSLRGIFILFLFLYHGWRAYPGDGTMPVVFFFVLGGFVMTLGYHDRVNQNDFNYKAYLTKRAIKFYPLHWICLIASVPFVITHITFLQIPYFVLNASLLQTWIPIKDVYFSYNTVSWYLADTLFFSVIFPFTYNRLCELEKSSRYWICVLIILLYIGLVIILPSNKWHAILYINPIVRFTDFLLGMGLACLYINFISREQLMKGLKKYHFILKLLVIFSLILIFFENCYLCGSIINLIAPFYWPLTAIIIFVSALLGVEKNTNSIFRNRVLIWLGQLSFTIFLVHQLVIRYAKNVFELLSIHNELVIVSICFVITLFVSFLLDRFILPPITQWLSKKIQPYMTARS